MRTENEEGSGVFGEAKSFLLFSVSVSYQRLLPTTSKRWNLFRKYKVETGRFYWKILIKLYVK